MQLLKACLSGIVSSLGSHLIEVVSSFRAHPSEVLLVVCFLAVSDHIDVEILPDRGCAAYLRAHLSGTSFIVQSLATEKVHGFVEETPDRGHAASRGPSIRGLARRLMPTRLEIVCAAKPPDFQRRSWHRLGFAWQGWYYRSRPTYQGTRLTLSLYSLGSWCR
jgi:hypothetical protein